MTRAGRSPGASGPANGYLDRSNRPFVSLLAILPALALYEIGTQFFTTAAMHGREQQVIAFSELRQFFHFFGASGRHLPAMAVIASLLAWHIAKSDRWTFSFKTLIGMVGESILLSLPLFCFGYLLARFFPLAATTHGHHIRDHLRDMVIMSLGAGIYEEFVFRLAFFALVSLLLRDVLRLHIGFGYLLMVLSSAVAFAAYHYLDPTQHFDPHVFAFRVMAGIYFGIVFLIRGFGVTSLSHISYDLIFTFTQLI